MNFVGENKEFTEYCDVPAVFPFNACNIRTLNIIELGIFFHFWNITYIEHFWGFPLMYNERNVLCIANIVTIDYLN